MKKSKSGDQNQLQVVLWLRDIYSQFNDLLLNILRNRTPTLQMMAFDMLLEFVKYEAYFHPNAEGFNSGFFSNNLYSKTIIVVFKSCHINNNNNELKSHTISKLNEYADLKMYFYKDLG